jgi:hypothetical protein
MFKVVITRRGSVDCFLTEDRGRETGDGEPNAVRQSLRWALRSRATQRGYEVKW